ASCGQLGGRRTEHIHRVAAQWGSVNVFGSRPCTVAADVALGLERLSGVFEQLHQLPMAQIVEPERPIQASLATGLQGFWIGNANPVSIWMAVINGAGERNKLVDGDFVGP